MIIVVELFYHEIIVMLPIFAISAVMFVVIFIHQYRKKKNMHTNMEYMHFEVSFFQQIMIVEFYIQSYIYAFLKKKVLRTINFLSIISV